MFELLLTPWGLGVLGLLVGSFLNVVAHRMPIRIVDALEVIDVEQDQRQWCAVPSTICGL